MKNISFLHGSGCLLVAVLVGSLSFQATAQPVTPLASAPVGTAQPSSEIIPDALTPPPAPAPVAATTATTAPVTETTAPTTAASTNLETPDKRVVTPVTETQPTTIMGKIMALLSPPPHKPLTEQEEAVQLARQHRYDESLAIFQRIYETNKANESVARDYTAVLGWAGQDQKAVDMYLTMPPQQPDYVLAAVGHSYRELFQTNSALGIYHLGLQEYPDSVLFAEGEIRCLADLGRTEEALAKANENIAKYGDRSEITSAQRDLSAIVNKTKLRKDEDKAVQMARQQQYPEALALLSDLHQKNPDNQAVMQDYLAVTGWAGGHDDQVVSLYKAMPADAQQPDYVLEAVGHAYRNLGQSDMALQVYQQGLLHYPNNVIFAEGVIRSLADQKKYDDAVKAADADLRLHGSRPMIVDARKNVLRLKGDGHRSSKKHSHH